MAKPESTQIEEPLDRVVPITDPDGDQTGSTGGVKRRPFALDKNRGSGRGNMPLMLIVLGAIMVFGIGMVTFLSTKATTKRKTAAEAAKPSLGRVATANAPGDLVPSDKMKPSPDEVKKGGSVDAADIERTKAPKIDQMRAAAPMRGTQKTGKPLSQVPAFQEPDTTPNAKEKWAPPPYGGSAGEQQELKRGEEALSKPSLVFTAHAQYAGRSESGLRTQAVNNLDLAPGYHVAARLEAMATTAVHAPVTTVIEYNYERNGQILIPAGSRAVGKISQADPSGLINITFSSLEFPGGETVPIEAVAADMSLQAIKGTVTGKQAGRNMLVRSLSGIGETAAMIVGAPSANSAFSENDLLRMRIADNIGNAGDQQIMQMMTMQHIVVSIPAGTEIYIIFERSQATDSATGSKTLHVPHIDDTAIESSASNNP